MKNSRESDTSPYVLTEEQAEALGASIAETLRCNGSYPDLDFFVQIPKKVPPRADGSERLLCELEVEHIGPGLFRRRDDGLWQYERDATVEERAMWRWAIYLWDRI